jgi:2-polyprenyl-3-methyl-5-hydroxy-6-metoxy-1,4-benzoquinol methylase
LSDQTDFDSKAKNWDHSEKRRASISRIATAIKERCNVYPSMCIMDFGAGTGLLTLEFCSSVRRVVAVDVSKKMLDALNGKLTKNGIDNVTILKEDIHHQISSDIPIQLIISSMTLHHLENPSHTIKRFFEYLDDNGQIAIADLEKRSFTNEHASKVKNNAGYGRSYLEELCLKAGFSSVSSVTIETYTKTQKDGTEQEFSVFLLTAEKETIF